MTPPEPAREDVAALREALRNVLALWDENAPDPPDVERDVLEPARAALAASPTTARDEWRELVAEMAPDYHAYGLIKHHADPNDMTGWHVKGIETCGDPLCVEAVRLLALSPTTETTQ